MVKIPQVDKAISIGRNGGLAIWSEGNRTNSLAVPPGEGVQFMFGGEIPGCHFAIINYSQQECLVWRSGNANRLVFHHCERSRLGRSEYVPEFQGAERAC